MSRPCHWDPEGTRHGGTPTYPWRMAPAGYFTRRQLRAKGLRPGGQDVAAQIMWPSRYGGTRPAYLYRLALARPVRPMTPAKAAALDKANRARRTCPACGQDAGYVLPAHLGTCLTCAGPAALAA
ncbi:RRQRL motif-containing zinc-binding protein [Kitasatospora sp. NPDC096077]|uniref:RRQRL motif-containing zinc-binding protein n=1 Tax=Kitasatospora sp. NPDC096077 TaxID=3155544 RepID=UPI0033315B92